MGMTKAEVIRSIGTPGQAGTGVSFSSSGLMMLAGSREAEVFHYSQPGTTNDCVVVFMDGKVVAYGPYVGSLREKYRDVFEEPRGAPSQTNVTSQPE
jgi:hypothetical protein